MKALIIIAHGSRQEEANLELEGLASQLAGQLKPSYDWIAHAFLEFATPTLADAIDEAIENGADGIDVYPYFLNHGQHVTRDIPGQAELLGRGNPECRIRVLRPFGLCRGVADLVIRDISAQA
jgi:sirohydrochlorin ferrochelatase